MPCRCESLDSVLGINCKEKEKRMYKQRSRSPVSGGPGVSTAVTPGEHHEHYTPSESKTPWKHACKHCNYSYAVSVSTKAEHAETTV